MLQMSRTLLKSPPALPWAKAAHETRQRLGACGPRLSFREPACPRSPMHARAVLTAPGSKERQQAHHDPLCMPAADLQYVVSASRSRSSQAQPHTRSHQRRRRPDPSQWPRGSMLAWHHAQHHVHGTIAKRVPSASAACPRSYRRHTCSAALRYAQSAAAS